LATGPWTQIYDDEASQHNDSTNLVPGNTYYYYVIAINTAGSSASSLIFGPVTPNASPGVPANLQAAAQTGAVAINLTWNPVGSATKYQVERSTADNSGYLLISEVASGITAYQDSIVRVGTAYFYRVRAVLNGVPSNPSAHATATVSPTQQFSGSSD
jgi:hypothetical protein